LPQPRLAPSAKFRLVVDIVVVHGAERRRVGRARASAGVDPSRRLDVPVARLSHVSSRRSPHPPRRRRPTGP
jgi:hypothetical protein